MLEVLGMKAIIVFFILFFSSAVAAAPTGDVKGSADHPVLTRFPGSVIASYRQVDYEEFDLPVGKRKGSAGGFADSEKVAGKFTSIGYGFEGPKSVVEIFENYQQALASAGFEVLFSCVNHTGCTDGIDHYMTNGYHPDSRYLAAKGGDAAAPTYVALFVSRTTNTSRLGVQLRVIESRAMKGGQVTATAAAISRGLEAQGKFALYGLYFDTGKAVLRPESDAALTEVAEVLKGSPSLRLYVVGHTDSTGEAQDNVELSERRASAAVKALVERYGVAAGRLTAKGVGPFAPAGPNKTEDGRAKNRRVELVAP
jgi:OmpA-OmpF porin, OOP family